MYIFEYDRYTLQQHMNYYLHLLQEYSIEDGDAPAPVAGGSEPGQSGQFGKGQMGSAPVGSPQFLMFFDRGTLRVLPLTYFYLPKVTGRAFVHNLSTINYFCSGPISVDPICLQPKSGHCASAQSRVPGRRIRGLPSVRGESAP